MAQRQSKRGFAAMDEEEVREIARRGGQASHGGQGGDEEEEEESEGEGRGAAGSTEAATRGGRNSRGGQGGGGQQGSRRVISRAIRVLNEIETRIEELKQELEEQAGGESFSRDGSSSQRSSGGNGRGFAGMDPEEQRRIASMGGRAAHEKGSAHEWDSEEAREAGRRGGQNSGGGNRG